MKTLLAFPLFFVTLSNAFAGPTPLAKLLESAAGKYLVNRSQVTEAAREYFVAGQITERTARSTELAEMVRRPQFKNLRNELRAHLKETQANFAQAFPDRAKVVFEESVALRKGEKQLLEELAKSRFQVKDFEFFQDSRLATQSSSQLGEEFLASQPARIESIEQWRSLGQSEQNSFLSDPLPEQGIATKEYETLSKIRNEKHRQFAEKLEKLSKKEMPDQEGGEFDQYVRIGEPSASFEIYTLPQGEIVGGRVIYRQEGTESKRYAGTRFANLAAALKVYVRHPNSTDVSWVWSITMDASGRSLPVTENYWQWTGF